MGWSLLGRHLVRKYLAAAMYLLPPTVATPPMPYGPLVQWHRRTDVCGPATAPVTSTLLITGVTPCGPATVQKATPYLTMVWQVPVAGGPLAIQPPDIQIVEAAIMAYGLMNPLGTGSLSKRREDLVPHQATFARLTSSRSVLS